MTKKKIESLTDAQRAKFPEYVERYTALGLSCAPADKPRAERGVRGHYEAAKIDCPSTMVWVSSPIVLAMAAPMAAYMVENGGPSAKALGSFVESTLKNVDAEVREAVLKAVAAVKKNVGWKAAKITPEDVRSAIQANWNRHNGGSWWISFVAWAVFVRDELGCEIPVGPREDTDSSAGWWWPHKKFVMLCDRPAELHRDVDGRLHFPTGPAISWRDGWGLHFWRGTRVPKEWIESPQTLDPALALNHENVEMRRCVAEILGWEKVLRLLNPVTIQTDEDPEIGTLLEVEIAGNRERFLKVQCGTGRNFVLPVPPDVSTALEANAWTYGLEAEELRKLEVRT